MNHISFFTIDYKKKVPLVYDFTSLDKGLNYLTAATSGVYQAARYDSNVKSEREILKLRLANFKDSINSVCSELIRKLQTEFRQQCELDIHRLMDSLKMRPLIYTGGGSTFPILRSEYYDFTDVMKISYDDWQKGAMTEGDIIDMLQLCPILSTAYGLAIHAVDDDIECAPLRDVFKGIRGAEEDEDDTWNNRMEAAEVNTGYRNYDRIVNTDYGCLNYTPKRHSKKR